MGKVGVRERSEGPRAGFLFSGREAGVAVWLTREAGACAAGGRAGAGIGR